MMREFSFSKHW